MAQFPPSSQTTTSPHRPLPLAELQRRCAQHREDALATRRATAVLLADARRLLGEFERAANSSPLVRLGATTRRGPDGLE